MSRGSRAVPVDTLASLGDTRKGHRKFAVDRDLSEESFGCRVLRCGEPTVHADVGADGRKIEDRIRAAHGEYGGPVGGRIENIAKNSGGTLA